MVDLFFNIAAGNPSSRTTPSNNNTYPLKFSQNPKPSFIFEGLGARVGQFSGRTASRLHDLGGGGKVSGIMSTDFLF